jgi:nitronate monooxygenase
VQKKQNRELIAFYDRLLEAERAGVAVLSNLIHGIEDKNLKIHLERFLRDEGMNCQIISALIKNSGEEPSKKTGDFVQKVNALGKMEDKLNLLIKGQEWVSKQIRKNRALFTCGSEPMFMESIKIQHEENVDDLKHILNLSYANWPPSGPPPGRFPPCHMNVVFHCFF